MKTENRVRPEVTVEQVIKRIISSGQITRADERWLFQAMTSEVALSHEEFAQIRRALERLQMGLLKIVD